ncbi:hypothetical protein FOCC_FOCC013605 [Frankliniella occidentalis]|nr:hypothetical protein FOCC_FOCC013605 [Frankliniella occidentalis]
MISRLLKALLLPVCFLLLSDARLSGQFGQRRTGGARKTVLSPRILRLEHCPGSGTKHFVYFHNYTSVVDERGIVYLSVVMEFFKTAKSLSMMNYTLTNGTLDLSLGETMAHINIAGNVWDTEVEFYDQDKELFSCVKALVLINRVNIKDR